MSDPQNVPRQSPKNELIRLSAELATLIATQRAFSDAADAVAGARTAAVGGNTETPAAGGNAGMTAAGGKPGDAVLAAWERTCRAMAEGVADARFRVAVVGAIKSGKSTFVNSLLGADHLKRGAGVTTAIVTRIRGGDRLRAVLSFKTWAEINGEMNAAMSLFPDDDLDWDADRFDIRDADHRNWLGKALAELMPEHRVTDDTASPGLALLSSCLKGYGEVRDVVAETPVVRHFDAAAFADHRRYAANDHLAVFLRDITLEVQAPALADGMEMADCQGSDSPNPLHLAMIEDYLRGAHLIVYVISSRTGPRQADIRFLTVIRKMGMLDNLMFVVNVDQNEHESPADLERLLGRVREALSLVAPDPRLHAFSALRNLFRSTAGALPEKDLSRLRQWEADADLGAMLDAGSAEFEAAFLKTITADRDRLLFRSHAERLGVIAGGLAHRLAMERELLGRDAGGVAGIMERMREHRQKTAGMADSLRSAVDGASARLKAEIGVETDRFFDDRYGPVTPRLLTFIRDYRLDSASASADGESRFSAAMYGVYNAFKLAVDRHLAEVINPDIIRFLREREARVADGFQSLMAPHAAMVAEILDAYNQSLSRYGLPPLSPGGAAIGAPDLSGLRSGLSMRLPAAEATMRYSAVVGAEAVTRFGLYAALRFFRRLIRLPGRGGGRDDRLRAMENGLDRLKGRMRGAALLHFKDLRENIKYQYLFKLVDAAADQIHERFLERFGAGDGDLSEMIRRAEGEKGHRTRRLEDIAAAGERLVPIRLSIRELSEGREP